MNYYEHHIGDYAQATSHLTFAEDAAYSRLLRKYYADESPLPADLRSVQRLVSARTDDEREAVETVLREFFTLETDGWHNRRADAEIEKVQAKREKARKSAKTRWNANASKNHANASDRDANASKTDAKAMLRTQSSHDVRNAHQTPDTRHQTPEEQKDEHPSDVCPQAQPADPCPHAEIIAAYHEMLPELARVRTWDDARQKLLRSRWRESAERQTVSWWREFFEYVRRCPFLLGQSSAYGDRDPFLADLEWLIRPSNFRKVIEGKYERRSA